MKSNQTCLTRRMFAAGYLTFGLALSAMGVAWDPNMESPFSYDPQTQPNGPYCGQMAGTNGVAYAWGNGEGSFATSAIFKWTPCAGWQAITGFQNTNQSGIPPTFYATGQAISIYSNYLYVGGRFDLITTNDPLGNTIQVPMTNIARMDLSSGRWSQVGDGNLPGIVEAIVVKAETNVYAGLGIDQVESDSGLNPETDSFQHWNGQAWSKPGHFQGYY